MARHTPTRSLIAAEGGDRGPCQAESQREVRIHENDLAVFQVMEDAREAPQDGLCAAR